MVARQEHMPPGSGRQATRWKKFWAKCRDPLHWKVLHGRSEKEKTLETISTEVYRTFVGGGKGKNSWRKMDCSLLGIHGNLLIFSKKWFGVTGVGRKERSTWQGRFCLKREKKGERPAEKEKKTLIPMARGRGIKSKDVQYEPWGGKPGLKRAQLLKGGFRRGERL